MELHRIGRYEILETLGRGAMGVVYLARDPIIGRRVALKTLRVDLDAEMAEEFRERFFREAQAAGRLNHPNIVTVHDVGEDPESGLIYIAMEYVQGRDLKELLAGGQRLRPAEAARIISDVAVALDYAHAMGVVHRDIKPANILLSRNGTARITDFGVARLESSNLTMDGQFIGTPNFMSPEQVAGRPVDRRSDIFSLGVVLFTLLTGQRPFAGGTMHEVTMRIVQEAPPIPSTVAPGIPTAFNPIILKCLEKDPDRRFQTGADVARVLAALARSLVDRDATDADRTGVVQPDLETRLRHELGPDLPTAEPQSPPPAESRWRSLRRRIPMPEFLRWEVEPRWVWGISTAVAVVVAAVVTGLMLAVDRGPFTAPSDASIRALDRAAGNLRRSGDLMVDGRLLDAESAALQALDQAPASPAARARLARIRELLEQARDSAEAAGRAESLVAAGRDAYRAGSYDEAAARFEEALELAPDNELAASYLELTRERQQAQPPARTTARATPVPRALATTPSGQTSHPVRPTPGTARITVHFDSPLSKGSVRVSIDGQSVAEVPFDFSSRGFLGIRKKGSGTVRRVIVVASGRRRIEVELRDGEGQSRGLRGFDRRLPAGSDWTLRIDQPSSSSEPGFFLVRASR